MQAWISLEETTFQFNTGDSGRSHDFRLTPCTDPYNSGSEFLCSVLLPVVVFYG